MPNNKIMAEIIGPNTTHTHTNTTQRQNWCCIHCVSWHYSARATVIHLVRPWASNFFKCRLLFESLAYSRFHLTQDIFPASTHFSRRLVLFILPFIRCKDSNNADQQRKKPNEKKYAQISKLNYFPSQWLWRVVSVDGTGNERLCLFRGKKSKSTGDGKKITKYQIGYSILCVLATHLNEFRPISLFAFFIIATASADATVLLLCLHLAHTKRKQKSRLKKRLFSFDFFLFFLNWSWIFPHPCTFHMIFG